MLSIEIPRWDKIFEPLKFLDDGKVEEEKSEKKKKNLDNSTQERDENYQMFGELKIVSGEAFT